MVSLKRVYEAVTGAIPFISQVHVMTTFHCLRVDRFIIFLWHFRYSNLVQRSPLAPPARSALLATHMLRDRPATDPHLQVTDTHLQATRPYLQATCPPRRSFLFQIQTKRCHFQLTRMSPAILYAHLSMGRLSSRHITQHVWVLYANPLTKLALQKRV